MNSKDKKTEGFLEELEEGIEKAIENIDKSDPTVINDKNPANPDNDSENDTDISEK